MCWGMAAGLQNHEEVPEDHFRRKLAAAVRSVQWSYAIFWSISARQQGMLEWSDGYYNGDIKTRKTFQPMELNVDQIGLQRCEQLRELYRSLSAGDNNQEAKRPSTALSPEDLTDSEWYYLVCMSFTFNPGQGLPGRALANGQHIWLCNAHLAESKVFSRSLLAKSASIQTVACFPLMGGVLELGVTELFSGDPALVQQITTTFLEFPKLLCYEQSTFSPRNVEKEDNQIYAEVDHGKLNSVPGCGMESKDYPSTFSHQFTPKEEVELNPIEEIQNDELKTGSSEDISTDCGANVDTEDSFMAEGIKGHSQVQSSQYMDDDFSNINSSDCISQSFAAVEKAASCENSNALLQELQECNHTRFSLLDLETNDYHYSKTLAVIFRNSEHLVVKPALLNVSSSSSLTYWRKDLDGPVLQICSNTSQKILKRVLVEVSWMHGKSLLSQHENGATGYGYSGNHVLSERKRREKLNEKFLILLSLIPSISKIDKASILGDTIEYLRELERRVNELEAFKDFAASEPRERRKHPDVVERTSDNCGHNANEKRNLINKRKASDIDEADAELNWVVSKDGLADVTVTIVDKEVSVELRCPWRDCLLLEIVDAISSLHLDAHSVQSSTTDGILALMLKSKFRGAAVESAWMIKQALQRVIGKF
ncbi:LOW QUALITY PROTEIN: transcription factor EGL1-like [Aristolochia californica]|uniref:LOW QUALITY PROTEIN: transcription factor EGL1-like n=1 Tax=Aristolochia californica TaxID=171875 RepID=UPI0035D92AE0